MDEHNFAAYQSGTFTTDITNLELDDKFFQKKDIPAFVHEYCHYIQDITTISSIFGFSLWMRDLVNLTNIFSKGEGINISIPLERDEHNETVNKFRKYYSLYCGDSAEAHNYNYSTYKSVSRILDLKEIDLDGNKQKIAVNYLNLEGSADKKIHFGLIVLQEIQAYYAQKMAELKLEGTDFSVKSENMPSFPYKFGDFLFDYYQITIDLQTKFILIDLCLDTIQAPSVFLDVLESLKGKEITYFGSKRIDLVQLVEETRQKSSYSNQVALENILPDLKNWASDKSRKYLSEALDWYIKQVEIVYGLKHLEGHPNPETFFSMAFCMDWENFALLFQTFPSPTYLNDDILYRNVFLESEETDKEFLKSFEAATTIWSHKVLYDLLCSENIEQIDKNAKCPLYKNCHLRTQIDDDYTCKMSPWKIIKNEKKIICQYSMAAHSFGLWQNSLEIKID